MVVVVEDGAVEVVVVGTVVVVDGATVVDGTVGTLVEVDDVFPPAFDPPVHAVTDIETSNAVPQ